MGALNIDDRKLSKGIENLTSTKEGRVAGAVMSAVFAAAKSSVASMASQGGQLPLTEGELMCILSYMESETMKKNSPKQMTEALNHGISILSAAVEAGVAEGLIFSGAEGGQMPTSGGLMDFASFASEEKEDG